MSSCEYGQIVGRACGPSVDNPANIKSVILAKCAHSGSPLYGLFRYVWPERVWFFSRFGHKQGIDFSHFGNKQGISFCTQVLNSFSFFQQKKLLPSVVCLPLPLLTAATHLIKADKHCLVGLNQGNNYKTGLKQGIDLSVRSYVEYQIFGQVINRVGKIADFGHKQSKVLGSGSHTPTQLFGSSPPEVYQRHTRTSTCLQCSRCIFRLGVKAVAGTGRYVYCGFRERYIFFGTTI